MEHKGIWGIVARQLAESSHSVMTRGMKDSRAGVRRTKVALFSTQKLGNKKDYKG